MHPFALLEVPAGKVAVHWFEQSSFALKSPGGTVVYIDPFFPHERPGEKYKYAQPPMADEATLPVQGVFLTHDHLDHTHVETLDRIHKAFGDCVFAGPAESAKHVREVGIGEDRFTTVKAGDSFTVGEFTGHFVYAKPPEGDPANKIDPPDVTHLGLVIACGAVRIFFSGDPIHTFPDLPALTGPVKKLAPQIGWLTCHPSEGEFPFFDGSVKMAKETGLRIAFPAHYECFVKRDYDPKDWCAKFEGSGVETRTVARNQHVLVP